MTGILSFDIPNYKFFSFRFNDNLFIVLPQKEQREKFNLVVHQVLHQFFKAFNANKLQIYNYS
jgi:hypothetical protein